MQEYKVKPDGFKEIRKQILLRVVPMIVIAGSAGILIGVDNENIGQYAISPLLFIIPFLALILGFSIFRGVKRQRVLFESYKLTIDGNVIKREQFNTTSVSLYFNDITQITKNTNGNFTIKGKNNGDVILIPAQIENYDQLEITLATIQPLSLSTSRNTRKIYTWLFILVSIAATICVYTSNDKITVSVSGALLVIMLLLGFIEIRRSKNIDNKTKRATIWILVVIIFTIVIVTFKLIGLK